MSADLTRLQGTDRMGEIFQPMGGPWRRTLENYRSWKPLSDLRSFSRIRRSVAMIWPMLTLKDHTMLSAADDAVWTVDEFFQRRAILPELQWIDSDAVFHVVGRPSGGTMA